MINNRRNMTVDFEYGQADGSVKSLAPDRGGDVESSELYKREAALRFNASPHESIVRPVNAFPR